MVFQTHEYVGQMETSNSKYQEVSVSSNVEALLGSQNVSMQLKNLKVLSVNGAIISFRFFPDEYDQNSSCKHK